MLLLLFF